MYVYGIGAAQIPDKVGETIDIAGIDTNELRVLNDEHGDRLSDIVGSVLNHKKIFSEKDIENPRQKKCWDIVKAPFLYVEGDIIDDPEHMDAAAAKALLRYTAAHPELPLKVGLSVEGAILERNGDGNKSLMRTKATGVSLTVKPCNSKCLLFPVNDLMKSMPPSALPQKYINALKNPSLTPSIKESKLDLLKKSVQKLKKSVDNILGEFTSMKCYSCGNVDKFFKASSGWPNHCEQCGDRFTMRQIYKALTK